MSDSQFGLLEIGWVRELNAVCNSPRLLALVLDRIDGLPDDIEALLGVLAGDVDLALARRHEIPAGPPVAPDPAPVVLSPAAAHLASLPFDGAWTRADDLSLLRASLDGGFDLWCEENDRHPREARRRLNDLTGPFSRQRVIAALEGR